MSEPVDERDRDPATAPSVGGDPKGSFVDSLSPGTLIKGTFRIVDFIGEGGAGAVYVAEHIGLGNLVAVKTLFARFVRDDDMRRRFIDEAVIQANLNHPNIVRVTDVLDDPPLCAIVMEYLEGSSLDRHLRRLDAPEPVAVSAGLLVSVLDAMAYAHAQGVVHRDIKPANVLLANGAGAPVPKVTDFGIAKVLSDNHRTETGTAMGTIYYAAPEQLADAKSVDHRADIYSIGCTLYELLTRSLPFEDPTMFGVMKKHMQAPRPDPARANPDVPPEVSAVVMRAMAVDPKHRFQSCSDFAQELRRAAGLALPVTANTIPRVGQTLDPARSFEPSEHGARPVIQRTPDTRSSRSHTGPNPSGASRSALNTPVRATARVGGPPSGSQRSTGGPTQTLHRPPSRNERNPVSMMIWGLSAFLAIGMLWVVLARDRGDESLAEVTPIAGGAAHLQAATAGLAAPADPSAPPEDGAPDEGSTAPLEVAEPAAALPEAEPEPVDTAAVVDGCRDLATRYVRFDPLGAVSIADAIADLETNLRPCEATLREQGAGLPFESAVAFLTTMQTQAVLHELLAVRAHGRGLTTYCDDVLSAATDAHRGVRRIRDAAESGELMPFEVDSLAPFRATLSEVYAHMVRSFSDCPIAPIADDLLDPSVSLVVADDAGQKHPPTL